MSEARPNHVSDPRCVCSRARRSLSFGPIIFSRILHGFQDAWSKRGDYVERDAQARHHAWVVHTAGVLVYVSLPAVIGILALASVGQTVFVVTVFLVLGLSVLPSLLPKESSAVRELDRFVSWLFDLRDPILLPKEAKLRCEDAMYIRRWIFGNWYVDGRLLLTETRLVHSKVRLRFIPERVSARFREREAEVMLSEVEALEEASGPLGIATWQGFRVRTRDSHTYRFDASQPRKWLEDLAALIGRSRD
jgi:hypothetical protein